MASVTDAFTRSNNATLGANWTNDAGSTVGIDTNDAQGGGGGGIHITRYSGITWGNDQASEITIGNNFTKSGPIIRWDGTSGYWVYHDSGLTYAQIIKHLGGDTVISTITTSSVDNDLMKLDATGNALTLYLNGVSIGGTTDSGVTSGSPGLMLQDIMRAHSWTGTSVDTPSAAISGTGGSGMTEANVVAGGKTLIITLTGDTWIGA